MAGLVWDLVGEHWFETGVDHGVLYPLVRGGKAYGTGVAWNGLTAVNETPEGAEPNDQYADNIKYLTLRSAETFGATIEAFTYPKEFRTCDGMAVLAPGVTIGQQNRTSFGFCYRTLKGNDTLGTDAGYIIHLIYGCTVSPSEKQHSTVNDSPEAMTFSWDMDAQPVAVLNHKPTATVTIDSTEVDTVALRRIETALYGDINHEPKLPLPEEVVAIMADESYDPPISLSEAVTASIVSGDQQAQGISVSEMYDAGLSVTLLDDSNTIKPTGNLKYVYDLTNDEKIPDEGNFLPLNLKSISKDGVVKLSNTATETIDVTSDNNQFIVYIPVEKDNTVTVKYFKTAKSENPAVVATLDMSALTLSPKPTLDDTVEVTVPDNETPVEDKMAGDLVEDGFSVTVDSETDSIKPNGTLKYIEGWSRYSKNPLYQNGNFLPLTFTPKDEGGTVKVSNSVTGGLEKEVPSGEVAVTFIPSDKDAVITVKHYPSGKETPNVTATVDLSGVSLTTMPVVSDFVTVSSPDLSDTILSKNVKDVVASDYHVDTENLTSKTGKIVVSGVLKNVTSAWSQNTGVGTHTTGSFVPMKLEPVSPGAKITVENTTQSIDATDVPESHEVAMYVGKPQDVIAVKVYNSGEVDSEPDYTLTVDVSGVMQPVTMPTDVIEMDDTAISTLSTVVVTEPNVTIENVQTELSFATSGATGWNIASGTLYQCSNLCTAYNNAASENASTSTHFLLVPVAAGAKCVNAFDDGALYDGVHVVIENTTLSKKACRIEEDSNFVVLPVNAYSDSVNVSVKFGEAAQEDYKFTITMSSSLSFSSSTN